MKRFKLNADDYSQVVCIDILPRTFDSPMEALEYAKKEKVVSISYLIQREDDGEDIMISMQEIADMAESGEDVQELDMF